MQDRQCFGFCRFDNLRHVRRFCLNSNGVDTAAAERLSLTMSTFVKDFSAKFSQAKVSNESDGFLDIQKFMEWLVPPQEARNLIIEYVVS